MAQDIKDYITELATPLKTVFQKQGTDSARKEEQIAALKNRLMEAVQTAYILSSERKQALSQTNEFCKYIDAHINLLKEFPKEFPEELPKKIPRKFLKNVNFDINDLCKKIMYTTYADVALNETGSELYKLIAAQVGLYPKVTDHKLHLSDAKVELMYDMALLAVSDGTCDGLVNHTEERIRSLEEMKVVINDLQIIYKREPLNKKVIEPLKQIKENYWIPLNKKRVISKEDEEFLTEALEQLSMVEKEIKIIVPRLENALKESVATEFWKKVTGNEHLLQTLQYCAALKWYEHKMDLAGQEFKYDVDFAVATRKRAVERMRAIEQSSGLLSETGFDLHRRGTYTSDNEVYWEKEVMFGGKTISDGHILLDSGANRKFLTKETNTGLDPLLDGDANIEFLTSHYKNNRHKETNLMSSEEYEEFLRFKAGQRQSGNYYVFNW